ncbi:MAG: MgtC/SapB family protein [Paeniclostridium sordellii]|uniref:MgtC/SapB family protein n=1 Tax=Paeniclostridium hominis TaxID=2764329 RepID=A0ABR7JZM6_9FIRM|nr:MULTISPECIES: MgtC/SapB family protein [Paeniclostridium]MBC6002305.1 MgtC/SapB family protein [Paeniclostridium hominis]MDU1539183.1 MgtC/SapB family protein [Paeniclostridium sordellii]MDU2591329.1 MgtC/SapB family protein [Paeniclostridium sordellii]
MDIKDIIIRILLAICIGGTIGYNRERENVSAGFRTHTLVCLGATVAALIQVELANLALNQIAKAPALSGIIKLNDGRFIGQVVSGIGFLGAGTIIKTKGAIKGLTTAASIWAVACVGIAIGMGFYNISILSGVSIVIVLVFLKKFEDKFMSKANIIKIKIKYKSRIEAIKEVKESIENCEIKIESIEVIGDDECLYTLRKSKLISINEIISMLIENKSIVTATKL